MGEVQAAMNTKDIVALGRALKEAERLNIDEVKKQSNEKRNLELVTISPLKQRT